MIRLRLVLALSGIGAALIGTAAYAAFPKGGPSPDPFVVGGGQFFGTQLGGAQRDFSLDSHAKKNDKKVYGVLRYGRNTAAAEQLVRNVSCVTIEGNQAVVGGTRPGADPPQGWVMFVIDDGAPGGALDQVTLVQELDLSSDAWPAGFPDKCPSPTQAADYGLVYENLVGGDVIVSQGAG